MIRLLALFSGCYIVRSCYSQFIALLCATISSMNASKRIDFHGLASLMLFLFVFSLTLLLSVSLFLPPFHLIAHSFSRSFCHLCCRFSVPWFSLFNDFLFLRFFIAFSTRLNVLLAVGLATIFLLQWPSNALFIISNQSLHYFIVLRMFCSFEFSVAFMLHHTNETDFIFRIPAHLCIAKMSKWKMLENTSHPLRTHTNWLTKCPTTTLISDCVVAFSCRCCLSASHRSGRRYPRSSF